MKYSPIHGLDQPFPIAGIERVSMKKTDLLIRNIHAIAPNIATMLRSPAIISAGIAQASAVHMVGFCAVEH